MARIQILELPMVTTGDIAETPFVLVIDQAAEEEVDRMSHQLDGVVQKCGARAALLSTTTLDVV